MGNASQGFARVIVDVPVSATADVDETSAAVLDEADRMYHEPEWRPVFLSEPEVQGVESLAVDQTTLRLVAKVRPGEQFRAARELRLRVRARLDRLPAGQATASASAK